MNRLMEQHKFHRYTAEDLRLLNSTAAYPDGRECKVCGTSANLKDASARGTPHCAFSMFFAGKTVFDLDGQPAE